MAAAAFLRELAGQRADLAPVLGELAELHEKKLWHELTLRLQEVVAAPAFCAPGDEVLVQLYSRFVSDFESKLNQLKLAHIAVAVSARLADPGAAAAFLAGCAAKLEGELHAAAPLLYLRVHVALLQLQANDVAAAKEGVEAARVALDALPAADATVSAAFYFVAASLAKAKQDFTEFYKAGLLYLAHTALDALPEGVKLARPLAPQPYASPHAPLQELAVDLSLAALLGEKVYNFGELLGHPVLAAVQGTQYAWLAELLRIFNAGDLVAYDAFCVKHAALLNAQPALVAAERALREKITVIALTEVIFALPAEQRSISLAAIGEKTQLSLDGVERLLMKTLSVHLIEGVIDSVAGSVSITWVQPRVLLAPQIAELRARLDGWIDKVHVARISLEDASPELIGAC